MFDPLTDEKYPRPSAERLPAGKLKIINPHAQRATDYAWVAKREPEYNTAKLGVISVSRHPSGDLHVIDGMHRVTLTQRVMGKDFLLDCEVFDGLTPKQEARLFLDRNDRKAVSVYSRFRASLTAEDETALGIVNILDALGLTHGDQKRAGTVCAVAALQRVYLLTDRNGQQTGKIALNRALLVLQRAFGDGASSFEGHLIEGMGLLYVRYGSKIETDRLTEKLASFKGGAPGLLGQARALRELKGTSVSRCVAATVADIYNKGRRAGSLGDWWAKG